MLSPVGHTFLFASLDSKAPYTARKVHIRRLYDIFQLSLQREDFPKAQRAWAILARCKEFEWRSMWMTGLLLLRGNAPNEIPRERLEFLRTMMLQNTDESQREAILQELVFCLIVRGEHRDALNELELYLPAFPFQDNPTLHTYAGLLSIYLAQPASEENSDFDAVLLRDAQAHFDRAKKLDPENVVTRAFLEMIPEFQSQRRPQAPQHIETDEEGMGDDTESPPRVKRTRV